MFDTSPGYESVEWVPCEPGWADAFRGDVTSFADFSSPADADTFADRSLRERLTAVRDTVAAITGSVSAQTTAADAADLVAALQTAQQIVNLLAPVDAALIAEVDRRGISVQWGHPSVSGLLVDVLRVRPAEAARRARAARATTPRTTLQGDVLPALREHVAAAQHDGLITADHATVIDAALRVLPAAVDATTVDLLEQTLVAAATRTDPGQVAKLGVEIRERLDPDGSEPDDRIDRHRDLTLRHRDDGMGVIRGVVTPELLAALHAVLDPLAAPRPADDSGAKDPRTAGQRLHDGLDDAMHRLLRSGTLPDSGGVPVTISVIINLEDLLAATGVAHTDHAGTVPVTRLLRMAAECEYIPVVLSRTDGIVSYGTTRRCAPPAMAKALRARDRGCTFPGCRRPASWTERHHIREHRHDGPTSLGNLALVCRWHHRLLDHHGWAVTMINGRPWWTPPAHLDPDRTPRRNTYWDTPSDASGTA